MDVRGAISRADSIPDLQEMAITIQIRSTENDEKVKQLTMPCLSVGRSALR